MGIITTATGKKVKTDMVAPLPYPHYLYIRVLEMDKETVESVFSDQAETNVLTYEGMVFEGYTTVGYVHPEGNALKVRLEKE